MSDLVHESLNIDLEKIHDPNFIKTSQDSNISLSRLPNIELFLNPGKNKEDWCINTSGGKDVLFTFYKYITIEEENEDGEIRKKRERHDIEICTKMGESEDSEIILNSISHINGRIISIPTYPEFSSWDPANNQYTKICKTIGSYLPIKNSEEKKAFSYIPPTPCRTIYDYNSAIATRSYNVADKDLFDYIGSRGESCKDCINNGHSIKEIEGNLKTCNLKGNIYMVVTHLGTTSRGNVKLKPVNNYVDSEGNPIGDEIEYTNKEGKKEKIRVFILNINLSPSSIRGSYDLDSNGKRILKVMGSYTYKTFVQQNNYRISESIVTISKVRDKTYSLTSISPEQNKEENDYEQEKAIVKYFEKESPDIKEIVKPIGDEYISGFTEINRENKDNINTSRSNIIDIDVESSNSLSSFLDDDDDNENIFV